MSRRSERKCESRGGAIEYVDGVVRLECPSGHPVGYLWRPDNGADETIRLDKNRRNGVRLADEQTLSFTCDTCTHDGKRLDLQLIWAKATAILGDAHQDRTRATLVHVLGG